MAGCRPLNDEELAKLVGSGKGFWSMRDRAFILLGCATGFRCSELLSLRRVDVLDRSGRIRQELTVKKRHMKKKVEARSVPLTESTRKILQDWLVEQERAGFLLKITPLFPRRGATPIEAGGRVVAVEAMTRVSAWKMIRRRARKARIAEAHTGTHSMRKTFTAAVYGSWLDRLAKGEKVDPIRQTQEALGHKNIQSTIAYLASVTVEDRAASFHAASRPVEACFTGQ
jgi:integrase